MVVIKLSENNENSSSVSGFKSYRDGMEYINRLMVYLQAMFPAGTKPPWDGTILLQEWPLGLYYINYINYK